MPYPSQKTQRAEALLQVGCELLESAARSLFATEEQAAIFNARIAAGLDPWPPHLTGPCPTPTSNPGPARYGCRAGVGGRGRKRHEEDAMQAACVAWYRYQYASLAPLLFAIPNGGQRGVPEAARMKKQGVTAGVPDLLLAVPTPRAPGLFLELKVGTNQPSPVQRELLARLRRIGYAVAVVRSLAEFRAAVEAHLGGPGPAVAA